MCHFEHSGTFNEMAKFRRTSKIIKGTKQNSLSQQEQGKEIEKTKMRNKLNVSWKE